MAYSVTTQGVKVLVPDAVKTIFVEKDAPDNDRFLLINGSLLTRKQPLIVPVVRVPKKHNRTRRKMLYR